MTSISRPKLHVRISRSFQVLSSTLPVPDLFPAVAHKFNDYLLFDFNVAAVHAAIYLAYYFVLDPVAAVSALVILR